MTSFLIEVDLIAISSSKLKERRVSGSLFSFFDFLDFFPHLFFSCLFPTDLTAVFFFLFDVVNAVNQQVAQGQYVVSDTCCPALHDCELK